MSGKIEKSQVVEALLSQVELDGSNVSSWREFVGMCRETVYLHPVALRLIPKLAQEAEHRELWADAVSFWNEQSLIADQYLRVILSKFAHVPGSFIATRVFQRMLFSSVEYAQNIVDAHNESDEMIEVGARQGLFKTKALFTLGEYEKAIPVIDETIDRLEQTPNTENSIELFGYKAEAFIRMGKVIEGVVLGLETYYAYDVRVDVLKLRDEIDYSRWISWRAGCLIKMVNAIFDINAVESVTFDTWQQICSCIQEVYALGTKDGVQYFDIRKQQLESIWSILTRKMIVTESLRN